MMVINVIMYIARSRGEQVHTPQDAYVSNIYHIYMGCTDKHIFSCSVSTYVCPRLNLLLLGHYYLYFLMFTDKQSPLTLSSNI